MKLKLAFWRRSSSHDELLQAKEKLESVKADDIRIDKLGKRVDKILDENNLAPAIMRALGVNR